MGANVNPDTAWIVGSAVTAVIMTGPAYIAARRSRTTASAEGVATRDALTAVRDELRSDIREVRDWQAAHTTEHAISALSPDARRPIRLERRIVEE